MTYRSSRLFVVGLSLHIFLTSFSRYALIVFLHVRQAFCQTSGYCPFFNFNALLELLCRFRRRLVCVVDGINLHVFFFQAVPHFNSSPQLRSHPYFDCLLVTAPFFTHSSPLDSWVHSFCHRSVFDLLPPTFST